MKTAGVTPGYDLNDFKMFVKMSKIKKYDVKIAMILYMVELVLLQILSHLGSKF